MILKPHRIKTVGEWAEINSSEILLLAFILNGRFALCKYKNGTGEEFDYRSFFSLY